MIATYAGCPHCHSITSMFQEQDRHGSYVSCLMCGFHEEDVPLSFVLDTLAEMMANERRRGRIGGRRDYAPRRMGQAL